MIIKNNKTKPLVILEVANNHMGDLIHTKAIIKQYYKITKKFENSIDFAIKFQHRDLKTYLSPQINIKDSRVVRFTSTELAENKWTKILNLAKEKFKIICTPFNEHSVDWVCKRKFDFLKIASCSFNDWPLLEKIKQKNINIICSLGGGSLKEITKTISFFSKKNIKYLYCVGMYPTPSKNINLSFFSHLKDTFGDCILGFSTHEDPSEYLSGAVAYGMGARIFEKHINVINSKYKINKYSVTPKKFNKWLENLNHAITLVGSIENRNANLKKEKKDIQKFQRGVFVKKNITINKGEEITPNKVVFNFPAKNGQFLANEFSRFKVYRSKKKLNSGDPIYIKNCKINDLRSKIELIRDRVKLMINKSKILLPRNAKLEISYHYGLNNFERAGLSMITVHNSCYCKKILFLFPNQSHPTQFHKLKQETFLIIMGKIELILDKKKYILSKGDMVTIKPNQKHFFKDISKSGSIIEELSTHSDMKDSYYLDKQIMKNKIRKSFISLGNK